jgi:tetratricopeptide (TPR) repeat protein
MRYALAFLVSAIALTFGTVASYRQISRAAMARDSVQLPPADTLGQEAVISPIMPTAAEYARFDSVDRVWRAENARAYTLAELRARGDGRRTPREAMQDRVFMSTRRGDRAKAIVELERWLRANPRDREATLSLARLLNESGRTAEAIARYRQLLGSRVGEE